VKQLGFARFQAVQKPFVLSFHVPVVLPLSDCSSGSQVIFPSGVKIILNFAPEGDTAVNGCPVKKVAFISFGAMGSAAKAAPPEEYYCNNETSTQHAKVSSPSGPMWI
jgi:hypothetical protein